MAGEITVADLQNAKLDVQTISEVAMVDYSADTTTNRNGDTIKTLVGQLKTLGYSSPVAYAGAISFGALDNLKTIERAGIVYAPLPSSLPFTTSGTWTADDDGKFFVIQVGSVASVDAANVNIATSGLASSDLDGGLDEIVDLISGNAADIGDLVALSGVAANATDLGSFTGTTIPDGSDIKKALQALETKVELAAILTNTSVITKTVGSGGDFATVKEGLEWASKNYINTYNSSAYNTQPKIVLNMLAGFTWAEQIYLEGVDLSFVTITGSDASTTVNRSALTTTWGSGGRAWMMVCNNARGPVIDQLFSMDTSGSSASGFYVINGSSLTFTSGAGIDDVASGFGLLVDNASTVVANGAYFRDCQYAVYVSSASVFYGENAIITNATNYGISVDGASRCDVPGANVSGASTYGIEADEGSTVNFEGGNATLCGNSGIYCVASHVNAKSASCRKTVGSNSASDIVAVTGGIIIAHSAVGGTTPGTKNSISTSGIIFG